MSVLGFTGSRNLSTYSKNIAGFVISTVVAQSRWSQFSVGCCPTGLDSVVRNSSFFAPGKLSVLKAATRRPAHG